MVAKDKREMHRKICHEGMSCKIGNKGKTDTGNAKRKKGKVRAGARRAQLTMGVQTGLYGARARATMGVLPRPWRAREYRQTSQSDGFRRGTMLRTQVVGKGTWL